MPPPLYRPRRLRESPLIRRMVRETRLGVDNFILPLFAVHGRSVREPIPAPPRVGRPAQRAAGMVKETIPALLVITDVCLCQYPSHGHCGIVEDGRVKNDASVDLLARGAGSHLPGRGRHR